MCTMELPSQAASEFQSYRDTFSFRHQSRSRRHGSGTGATAGAATANSAAANAGHFHHDLQHSDQNRNRLSAEGIINGTIVDETGRHSTRWQGQCNHKYCAPDGQQLHSDFVINNSIKTGPYCHEKGQSIDATSLLVSKLAALYGDQELSDIQIMVGHSVYHAHKLVLCCSSDVFRVMLTKPQWPESQCAKIVLKEEPECIAVFAQFLQYIYTGMIHLNHDTVMAVLMLADKYNVKDLREVCTDYMMSHLVSVVHRNRAVSWLQYAQLSAHEELAIACTEFIKWNFYKVASCPDFLLMEKENFMYFLQDSDLVVPDEYALFKIALLWLHHQESTMMVTTGKASFSLSSTSSSTTTSPLTPTGCYSFHNLVLDVLSAVRFPLMLVCQLRHLEAEACGTHLQGFISEKVRQGTQYHAQAHEHWPQHLASVSDEHTMLYTPRNFTNEVWATALSIDNFASLAEHEVQPLFFASPVSGSEADENRSWEWNADLFPKGVHFQKCIMIGLWRNLEVCGTVYNTVRLKLEAKTPEERAVNVSILVTGVQDNVEYVRKVVERHCHFDKHTTMYNFNEIVPFEELNSQHSPYLSNIDRNSFKITIIVKPV